MNHLVDILNKLKSSTKLMVKLVIFFIFTISIIFVYNTYKLKVQAAGKQVIILNTDTQTYTYDGKEKPFKINGTLLSFDVEYLVNQNYVKEIPVNAGTYTVKITRLEDDNYYPYSKVITNGLIINKAKYDLEGISVIDTKCVYDGKYHYPTFNKELPIGVDGSTPLVTYSKDIMNVEDGLTRVNITITSESKNYENPNLHLTGYVEILPFPVEITWCEDNFTYNGQNQKNSLWATYFDAFGNKQNFSSFIN